MAQRSFSQLVIGISVRSGAPEWVQKSTRNYLNILDEYGVRPVILAPDYPAVLPGGATFAPDEAGRLPEWILDELDGLVLSGGGDVHPRYFGQPIAGAEPDSIDLKRDELELGLGRAALAQDLPTFAICRGCQVLNVAAAGGMIQHFDGHRSLPDRTVFHPVEFTPGSRVHQIVGQDKLVVNTFHHQGIDQATLAPGFAPAAYSVPERWLIEAYESPHHNWVVGVQWHPERIFELGIGHRLLWESFLDAAQRGERNVARGRSLTP